MELTSTDPDLHSQDFCAAAGAVKLLPKNEIIPEKVSWSFGPILNEGGFTVTCSVGDFYIYAKGLTEE